MVEPTHQDRTLVDRLLRLDARFIDALGRITGAFVRETVGTIGQSLRILESRDAGPFEPPTPPSPRAAPTPPPAPQQVRQPGGTVMLEEEAGKIAHDVFLVQNLQSNEVTMRPEISEFVNAPAPGVRPNVSFEPKEIKLAPRSQVLVRIMTFIDDTFQPDVSYFCEVQMPTLSSAKTPVVIRRRQVPPAISGS